uniref:Uncharacterized protein n=1 Tax=uncultured bacterium contig00132 TaxID=1181581 RepID=A0A806KDT2_9BACT|nr:hypothetical protein [uncultured bacterium contig00132]
MLCFIYTIPKENGSKIEAPTGSSIVKLSVPAGIYIVRNVQTKEN